VESGAREEGRDVEGSFDVLSGGNLDGLGTVVVADTPSLAVRLDSTAG
jgi:hypothetical protein